MCVGGGGGGGGVAHYSCCSVFQTFTNFGIVLMEANSPPLSLSLRIPPPPPPLLSFSEFVLSVDVSENVIVKSQSGGGGG